MAGRKPKLDYREAETGEEVTSINKGGVRKREREE